MMNDSPAIVPAHQRPGTKRKSPSLKIDMTPMVDLGFLLISFFVITTQLNQPKVMDIIVPADGPPIDLADSKSLTLILTNGKIIAYRGEWEKAKKEGKVTSLSKVKEVRDLIQATQQDLDAIPGDKEKRDGLMVLIKSDADSKYNSLVNILDEMVINDVKKYALVSISGVERNWLRR